MNIAEMEAACDASDATGHPEILVNVPGGSGRGKRKRIAPGLNGAVVSEGNIADGTPACIVALEVKDARRYIARIRYREMYHGGPKGHDDDKPLEPLPGQTELFAEGGDA